MALEEQKTGYTREVIMEYTTDGVDHWNLTRKEELIRCKDCKWYSEKPSDPDWDRCECPSWYDGDGGDQYVRPTDYCSFAERRAEK